MIAARVISCVLAALGVLAGFGWLLEANVAHAVGFVAGSLLAYVLSTVPVGRVP